MLILSTYGIEQEQRRELAMKKIYVQYHTTSPLRAFNEEEIVVNETPQYSFWTMPPAEINYRPFIPPDNLENIV